MTPPRGAARKEAAADKTAGSERARSRSTKQQPAEQAPGAKKPATAKATTKQPTTPRGAAKGSAKQQLAAAKSSPRKSSAPKPPAKTSGAAKNSAKQQPAATPIRHDAGDHTRDTAPLGAHVSVAGGIWEAATRCQDISSTGSQIFTKQANRWLERAIEEDELLRYRSGMAATTVRWTCAHDSYLINLASPDPALRARSIESFRCELRRCHTLGLDALVSHPGNFMDERASGLQRNVDGIVEALESEPGSTRLLMELTAGQGTVLASTFEEMAALLDALPATVAGRVGVCLDTAHVWAAGYDLATDYDGVMQRFSDTIGLHRLECLHLNDSKAKLGSHLDRHELIAEGTIGADAFRRIMTDDRLAAVPKVIETPKGDDHAASDARMLARLRGYAAGL